MGKRIGDAFQHYSVPRGRAAPLSPMTAAPDDRFIERVRAVRAAKKYGAEIKTIVTENYYAVTLPKGTTLWSVNVPRGYTSVFEAGGDRAPVSFVIDESGAMPRNHCGTFEVTDELALIDMRKSRYRRSRDTVDAVRERIVDIIGRSTGDFEPFNARFFAGCMRSTRMRGFLWDEYDMVYVTIFSPGKTNLADLSLCTSRVKVVDDLDLYRAVSRMKTKTLKDAPLCEHALAWNKLEKSSEQLDITGEDLEKIHAEGLEILEQLHQEILRYDDQVDKTQPDEESGDQRDCEDIESQ